jgi:putative hydroxymethylpyrimidine transport system permease protein
MARARPLLTFAGLLATWQFLVWLLAPAPYILPGPLSVVTALAAQAHILAGHAAVTLAEMLLGFAAGALLGGVSALTMAYFRPARQWLMPVLVVSQAVPVFALAPLLVLWFGYGIAPKVAMATLIVYFPVTAAFHDGLRRTQPGWLDLAHTMGASRWTVLRHVRLPAALPACASGLRIAAAPWSASGSAPRPAWAITCCTPMRAS